MLVSQCMAPTHQAGTGVPSLIDCWHVRDLQRFRAVLKGGPAAAGLPPASYASSYSKSPSHSGGHSWGTITSTSLGPAAPSEVNRRDPLGRTALHLIASSEEGASIDFLHALLAHPSTNPNVQDLENGWTALHRALYLGNLIHALALLRHPLIDLRVKDFENLTPFDLYNSTVAGTNPPPHADIRGDLYAWGTNRNFTLGLGDGDDRYLPDLVNLRRSQDISNASKSDGVSESKRLAVPGKRFDRIHVKDMQMSRMHTVVLTSEKSEGNIWVAGIGSAGRLGRATSTQPFLTPLADFSETAVNIAVGPDHTIIVTDSGTAYSFGLNRFAVLGYVPEEGQGQVGSSGSSASVAASTTFGSGPTVGGNKTFDVQITPRKIVGPLKKEHIVGCAASKLHSVVFTEDSLYTWGTNTGQLGYDKVATPTQTLPRKVTTLTAAQATLIRQVTCTDHATALLLNTYDVLVFHGDMNFRVQFPMARFSEKMSAGVFRPPQAQPKPSIAKLTSSGSTFAALSDYGDLFTFALDHPSEYAKSSSSVSGTSSSSRRAPAPEPQLVWSVRKKFTAVRDVAIGADGSIILSTSSGHVFVRSRRGAGEIKSSSKSGSARAFKFAQVPLLQRVVKVATNESGGFAAIRKPGDIKEIKIKGKTLEEDLLQLLPHLRTRNASSDGLTEEQSRLISTDIATATVDSSDDMDAESAGSDEDDHSDGGDSVMQRHLHTALLIIEAAKRWDRDEDGQSQARYGPHNLMPPRGCDIFVIASGKYLPAHRVILAARLPSLAAILENPPNKGAAGAPSGVVVKRLNREVCTLTLPSCSFHTALFLLHYLYTDDTAAVWTTTIGMRVEKEAAMVKMNRQQVQNQLKDLASLLRLPALSAVLSTPIPRTPSPTLRSDLRGFFESSVSLLAQHETSLHDVRLILADREVLAHSLLLQRSPFFAALLQPVWTASRWNDGLLDIDLSNLRYGSFEVHLRHLYSDSGIDTFDDKDLDLSHDEWIDYLTETLANSDEILLDKLKLVISSLLRARITPQTISAILTVADMYHAGPLKEASLLYCAQNLESLLEVGMLDELEHKMVRELSVFIKRKQDERLHRTAHLAEIFDLVDKHQDFYASLDIPPPSLNLVSHKIGKRGPRSAAAQAIYQAAQSIGTKSPARTNIKDRSSALSSAVAPTRTAEADIFAMDEDDLDQVGMTTLESQSPSLGAMANLSLDTDSMPAAVCALPAPARPVAAWSAVRRPTSESSNVTTLSTVESSASPPRTADFRSIMAAEQARTSGRSTPAGQGPQAIRRLLSSHNSDMSAPPSGSQTPLSETHLTTPPFGDVSPLNISTKLSQRDRKRQQQAQARNYTESNIDQQLASTPPAHQPGSAWKLPQTQAQSVPGANTVQPARPVWQLGNGKTKETAGAVSPQPTPTAKSPVLGPTYTPTKNPSSGGVVTGGSGVATFPRPSLNSGSAWPVPSNSARSPTGATKVISPSLVRGNSDASASQRTSLSSVQVNDRPSSRDSSMPARGMTGATAGAFTGLSVAMPSNARSSSSSFAQIQAQQAAAAASSADLESSRKKSFIQIQHEESQAETERKKAEEEKLAFERWFEEESKKYQGAPQSARGSTGQSQIAHSRHRNNGLNDRPSVTEKGKGKGKAKGKSRGNASGGGNNTAQNHSNKDSSSIQTSATKTEPASETRAATAGSSGTLKGDKVRRPQTQKGGSGSKKTSVAHAGGVGESKTAEATVRDPSAQLSASAAVFRPGGT